MYWIVVDTGPAIPVAVCNQQTSNPQNPATNLFLASQAREQLHTLQQCALVKVGGP